MLNNSQDSNLSSLYPYTERKVDKNNKNSVPEYYLIDYHPSFNDISNSFFDLNSLFKDYVQFSPQFKSLKLGLNQTDFTDLIKSGDSYLVIREFVDFSKKKSYFHKLLNFPLHRIISLHDLLIYALDSHQIIHQPSSIRLEASTICNLDCADCYMRKDNSGTVGAGYLKYDDLRDFILSNPFIKRIELSNSGEVFMNPDLLKILQFLKQQNIKVTILNGVNLNNVSKDVLKEMVKGGITEAISVSIDGATQEIYSQYRRKGNLSNVLNNIKLINYYKSIYNKSTPALFWQYILFEHNYHEAEMAKAMAECLNMKIFFKLDWGKGLKPNDPEKLEKITGLKFFNREAQFAAASPHYVSNSMCRQLICSPQINWDGRLLGCCTVYKQDFGVNVFKQDFVTSLNSGPYSNAVKLALGNNADLEENIPCFNCKNYSKFKDGNKLII